MDSTSTPEVGDERLLPFRGHCDRCLPPRGQVRRAMTRRPLACRRQRAPTARSFAWRFNCDVMSQRITTEETTISSYLSDELKLSPVCPRPSPYTLTCNLFGIRQKNDEGKARTHSSSQLLDVRIAGGRDIAGPSPSLLPTTSLPRSPSDISCASDAQLSSLEVPSPILQQEHSCPLRRSSHIAIAIAIPGHTIFRTCPNKTASLSRNKWERRLLSGSPANRERIFCTTQSAPTHSDVKPFTKHSRSQSTLTQEEPPPSYLLHVIVLYLGNRPVLYTRLLAVTLLSPSLRVLRSVDTVSLAECILGRGGLVVRLLALIPPHQTGFDSRRGRIQIFAFGNCAGRCRGSEGFLGNLLFPLPLHSDAAPYSRCFTIIGSQNDDVKRRLLWVMLSKVSDCWSGMPGKVLLGLYVAAGVGSVSQSQPTTEVSRLRVAQRRQAQQPRRVKGHWDQGLRSMSPTSNMVVKMTDRTKMAGRSAPAPTPNTSCIDLAFPMTIKPIWPPQFCPREASLLNPSDGSKRARFCEWESRYVLKEKSETCGHGPIRRRVWQRGFRQERCKGEGVGGERAAERLKGITITVNSERHDSDSAIVNDEAGVEPHTVQPNLLSDHGYDLPAWSSFPGGNPIWRGNVLLGLDTRITFSLSLNPGVARGEEGKECYLPRGEARLAMSRTR
ncbi:hypothetical protein PR048_020229 [Dryococelus australis]|uniref:Uncharacterized protein n=1 Tax=Dryococelus australis TaxID=614101 RepID=A0ABQ9H5Y0_9NEOP|nr:hypothetical protein PR048_020229 [Dryococelus australis]